MICLLFVIVLFIQGRRLTLGTGGKWAIRTVSDAPVPEYGFDDNMY